MSWSSPSRAWASRSAPRSRSEPRSGAEESLKPRLPSGHEGKVEAHAASVLDGTRSLERSERPASIDSSSESVDSAMSQPVSRARITAESLFRAHAQFVAGFVFRLGVERESVDDVVQEVFLTAHRRGGFEEGPARPTTWLAEIALRVVSTHRRTDRRRRVHPDQGALEIAISDADRPDQTAERRSSLRIVERALDGIDVDKRAVFILFEIEGASSEDIAAGLGIPLGTVYSRLHAARKEFQKAYDRLAGDAKKSGAQPANKGRSR